MTSRSRLAGASMLAATLLILGLAALPAGQFRVVSQADYYAGTDGLSRAALRTALHEIIDDHEFFPYSSSATDTQDIIRDADEVFERFDSVLTVYKNSIEPKVSDPTSWSREHLWPRSRGFPERGQCNYPDTDVHAVFASDMGYNNARGNGPFDWCPIPDQCREYVVDGFPGTPNRSGLSSWEVWPGRRGDVARAMLYLDVRYEGGTHGYTGCSEPDLVLTDDLESLTTTKVNAPTAYMGILSTLLAWHKEDPPDSREHRRNGIVMSYQGNANPFVDDPERVCLIWGPDACASTIYLPTARR